MRLENDGDKALVIQDETLIQVSEREMKGIVPLYYEMAKAEATDITSDKMFESLTSAYKANIGIISNDITKIWNSPEPNINAVKWLTMYNNFVIDFAKTLFLPKPPKKAEEIIKSFTKNKVPHFFMYAKDKEEGKVEKLNDSTVNKLYNLIPDKPIQFKNVAGRLKYKNLMYDKKTEIDENIVQVFAEFERSKYFSIKNSSRDDNPNDILKVYSDFRNNVESKYDVYYFVDVLILYYYKNKINNSKTTLWNSFGDILYDNLLNNIGNTIQCESCNKRIVKMSESQNYCDNCAKKILQIQKNKWKRNNWKKS